MGSGVRRGDAHRCGARVRRRAVRARRRHPRGRPLHGPAHPDVPLGAGLARRQRALAGRVRLPDDAAVGPARGAVLPHPGGDVPDGDDDRDDDAERADAAGGEPQRGGPRAALSRRRTVLRRPGGGGRRDRHGGRDVDGGPRRGVLLRRRRRGAARRRPGRRGTPGRAQGRGEHDPRAGERPRCHQDLHGRGDANGAGGDTRGQVRTGAVWAGARRRLPAAVPDLDRACAGRDGHRRLRRVRAAAGGGRPRRHRVPRGPVQGAGLHRGRRRPRPHRDDLRRHLPGRADLLAERRQGRQQLPGLLRRELGRRGRRQERKRHGRAGHVGPGELSGDGLPGGRHRGRFVRPRVDVAGAARPAELRQRVAADRCRHGPDRRAPAIRPVGRDDGARRRAAAVERPSGAAERREGLRVLRRGPRGRRGVPGAAGRVHGDGGRHGHRRGLRQRGHPRLGGREPAVAGRGAHRPAGADGDRGVPGSDAGGRRERAAGRSGQRHGVVLRAGGGQHLDRHGHAAGRAEGARGDCRRQDADRSGVDGADIGRRQSGGRLLDRGLRGRRNDVGRSGRRHRRHRDHAYAHGPPGRLDAPLPGLGDQRGRAGRRLVGGGSDHRPRRAGGAAQPVGVRGRRHGHRPGVGRAGARRRPRGGRLPDRAFAERRRRLDGSCGEHGLGGPYVRGRRPAAVHPVALPGLGDQRRGRGAGVRFGLGADRGERAGGAAQPVGDAGRPDPRRPVVDAAGAHQRGVPVGLPHRGVRGRRSLRRAGGGHRHDGDRLHAHGPGDRRQLALPGLCDQRDRHRSGLQRGGGQHGPAGEGGLRGDALQRGRGRPPGAGAAGAVRPARRAADDTADGGAPRRVGGRLLDADERVVRGAADVGDVHGDGGGRRRPRGLGGAAARLRHAAGGRDGGALRARHGCRWSTTTAGPSSCACRPARCPPARAAAARG